jgi:hypothetical protein
MKSNVVQTILVVAIGLATAGTSYAHEDYSEGGSLHWISHVAESKSQPTANQVAPYGYVTSSPAARVANVDSNTLYINVTRGEAVQINVAGKSVTWLFDTLGTPTFSLDKIVPGAGNITVYVAPNPSDAGG